MLIDADDPTGEEFKRSVSDITSTVSEEDRNFMVAGLVGSFHFEPSFAKQVVNGTEQVNLILQDMILRYLRSVKEGIWVRKNFGATAT